MVRTDTETINPDGSLHVVATMKPRNLKLTSGTKTYKVNNHSAGAVLDITITDGVVTGTYKQKWQVAGFGTWGTTLDYSTNVVTKTGKCTA